MSSPSDDKEAEITQAFNLTSRYLDDLSILKILTLKVWWVEFIHLSYSSTKLMRLMPIPYFSIYIYLFQTDLFDQNL